MTYLDWASTSPPERAFLEAGLAQALEEYGNPSSRHSLGTRAKASLGTARARLLDALGGRQGEARLVLTSGGSEADALVLLALLRRKDTRASAPPHLVTTSIEHAAIHEQALLLQSLGIPVSFVDPQPDGRVRPEDIGAALRRDTGLVAVMAVNNETGAVQPLGEISGAIQRASASLGRREAPPLHSDAVQALGKIDFDPAGLGLASAAFSAHKIQGPRGVGALWLKTKLEPLVLGGGQELGLRPGTENLQGAVAFAAATEAATAGLGARLAVARTLEARLLEGLATMGALPLPLGRQAGDGRYSPWIVSAAFPGLSGEVLARALSDKGIAVSTGSACSTNQGKKGRRVLEAMGLAEELGFASIRISFGPTSTMADIDLLLETASALWRQFRT